MSETRLTITLPPLGEDVTEATISRWLVAVGDEIDAEEPLLEVATDKVDTEIPSPRAGTLVEVLVEEDETVDVGTALAIIEVRNLLDGTPAAISEPPPPAAAPAAQSPEPNEPAPVPTAPVLATDTGPVSISSTNPSDSQRLPRIRQIIATRMLESLRTTAQLTSVVEIDVTGISHLRAASKADFLEQTGVKLSFLPFFAKATVEALGQHPIISATVNTECTEIAYYDGVNLGVAVDSPKGLMVPVLRGAHQLSIKDLAIRIAEIAGRVRTGSISPDDLNGGTFTLTNTGSRGALFDTPILNTPQSGILGTGAVVERVVPRRDADGDVAIGVRSMVYFALTYDHRIVDGADAARFLTTIKHRLEYGFTTDEVMARASTAHA